MKNISVKLTHCAKPTTLAIALIVASTASVSLSSQGNALVAGTPTLNIHSLCETSPKQCLANIEATLQAEQAGSRRWFQYKAYQLDALFQLLRFSELEQQLSPWLDRDDIPLKFSIQVQVYSAKILLSQGEKVTAEQRMGTAVSLMKQVNAANYDPFLVVQIANGLNALGQNQQGYDLLLPLVEKYKHRPMAKFKHELFENLGHFAARLGMLEEHLRYRIQALNWAKVLANDTQEAISLYNVARAYQMLNHYSQAYEYFAQAEQLQALGNSDQNMVFFRRAQLALAQGDIAKAERYFSLVKRGDEFAHYQVMFTELAQQLSIAKQEAEAVVVASKADVEEQR